MLLRGVSFCRGPGRCLGCGFVSIVPVLFCFRSGAGWRVKSSGNRINSGGLPRGLWWVIVADTIKQGLKGVEWLQKVLGV